MLLAWGVKGHKVVASAAIVAIVKGRTELGVRICVIKH